MSNILCKMGLHKWRKVKSTGITIMNLMEDIIRVEGKILIPRNSEETMCRKFGVNRNTLCIGYDLVDCVCERCGKCEYNINEERNKLIKKRNKIVRKEISDRNKDRLIENMYKGCKNER